MPLLAVVKPEGVPNKWIMNFIVVIAIAFLANLPHTWCLPPMLRTVMLSDSVPIYNLKPFPENTLCLHVNVTHTTHPSSCHWIINETQAVYHRDYIPYADGSSLVLQPFGHHFCYTYCTCLVVQTGAAYTVYIGGPGKWNEHLGTGGRENLDVSLYILLYHGIKTRLVSKYCILVVHTASYFALVESYIG